MLLLLLSNLFLPVLCFCLLLFHFLNLFLFGSVILGCFLSFLVSQLSLGLVLCILLCISTCLLKLGLHFRRLLFIFLLFLLLLLFFLSLLNFLLIFLLSVLGFSLLSSTTFLFLVSLFVLLLLLLEGLVTLFTSSFVLFGTLLLIVSGTFYFLGLRCFFFVFTLCFSNQCRFPLIPLNGVQLRLHSISRLCGIVSMSLLQSIRTIVERRRIATNAVLLVPRIDVEVRQARIFLGNLILNFPLLQTCRQISGLTNIIDGVVKLC